MAHLNNFFVLKRDKELLWCPRCGVHLVHTRFPNGKFKCEDCGYERLRIIAHSQLMTMEVHNEFTG